MFGPRNESRTRPTRPAARGVLIVARDQHELYRNLQRAHRDTDEILVLRDRRQGERRRASHPVADERRHRGRRRLPALAEELRVQPAVRGDLPGGRRGAGVTPHVAALARQRPALPPRQVGTAPRYHARPVVVGHPQPGRANHAK
jgi:hypothetical protein